jgi:hypothetical protein
LAIVPNATSDSWVIRTLLLAAAAGAATESRASAAAATSPAGHARRRAERLPVRLARAAAQ